MLTMRQRKPQVRLADSPEFSPSPALTSRRRDAGASAVSADTSAARHAPDPWEEIISEARERASANGAGASASGSSGTSVVTFDGRSVRGGDWTKIVRRG